MAGIAICKQGNTIFGFEARIVCKVGVDPTMVNVHLHTRVGTIAFGATGSNMARLARGASICWVS